MLLRALVVALTIASAIPLASAQSVKAFDMAAIKPHDPGDPAGRADILPGGRVIFHNISARSLFEYSYGVQHYETSGEPAWFDERYDIDAKAYVAREMTEAEVKLLLGNAREFPAGLTWRSLPEQVHRGVGRQLLDDRVPQLSHTTRGPGE